MPPFYQQMYAAWYGIVERLYKANPDKADTIDSAVSCEVSGVGLVIHFICQYMFNEDEYWLDIALSDLVAMMKIGKQLRCDYRIGSFKILVDKTPDFEQMYGRKYGIYDILERVHKMNPSRAETIDKAKAACDVGEVTIGVDVLCQFIRDEEVKLDIMLSDFLSLLKLGKRISSAYNWDDFAFLNGDRAWLPD